MNLSLTLEDNTESAAKVIAAPLKSLDSVTKEVLDDRTALDYLSLSKEVSVLWPTPLATLGLTLLRKLRIRITE